MDFIQINAREIERGPKKGQQEIYPDFVVGRSNDLMVRARSFYAIWDEDQGLWSTDEYDVQRLVDIELARFAEQKSIEHVKWMRSFGSNGWNNYRRFLSLVSDNAHQLDESLSFANSETKKKDYVSRRLPYSLAPGDISAWDELISTLYNPEERAKIEWAIGSVIAGDSKTIQKFLVFYGPAGTGKSTILNIIEKLFVGYTTTFEAKALGSNNGSFATEAFRGNPLVAIQHDGDLSKIEDNTRLNSIISHEQMTMNEKYKPSYTSRVNAYLFMGTNQPVKISDAKSGIIRRLIDVHPTGEKLAPSHYHALMARIDFELGAIAQHCLDVYRSMGKNYYNSYQPLEMMFQTDIFFNFIEASYETLQEQDGIALKQAYKMYKQYCEETGIDRVLPQYKVREELRNYFREFKDRADVDGVTVRSYYTGFKAPSFKEPVKDDVKTFSLVMDDTTSIFDLEFADHPAQGANDNGTPKHRWANVKTTLAEIDTSELHYVQLPDNHIVIDFDLVDEDGNKSLERNLAAASEWPPTYGELSRSGKAVHLHYVYTGDDAERLDSVYADGIEIKRYVGNGSLRRKLTRCNNVPIGTLNSGLPLKEKKVLHADVVKSERGLRELILRNLRKEIHPGTKPSIDFINTILDQAYESGMQYDVTDLKSRMIGFANDSTNQPLICLKIVQRMRFKSDEAVEAPAPAKPKENRLVFFDVEVFPNLFLICWKYAGESDVVAMINPKPWEVEELFQYMLVGFNVRRYDNHIMWAASLGYSNEQLYQLSQKIISGVSTALFGEAYNLSYADIYDFSSVKQGLKKFQIQLGLPHKEMDHPWDEPVPSEKIPEIVEYCKNDTVTQEAVFESRKGDFVARQILAELSGLTVNDTTAKHTARIIFGEDRNPQRSFIYTDLSKEFPGYVYDKGVSTYRGEVTGEGGYVYAEPGIYENVALLDVASMHPTSIGCLDLFGREYTRNFLDLLEARLAIKRKAFDQARGLLNGALKPFLEDTAGAEALAYALKIVINIVYGLTSAKFDNPFRDLRNVDNIVAKRGALFMIDLKHFVQERGFTAAHIKTDSIKIPNATPEIIEEVKLFGEKYGYTFEHEATYDKFCLVNDAVYIARSKTRFEEGHGPDPINFKWVAVGAQFQHPYVYKTLFTHEDLVPEDLYETKQVQQGAMYIDFHAETPMALTDDLSRLHFVGRTGRFVPVVEGFGGGVLYRIKDGKRYAVAGTKGYLWMESEMAAGMSEEAIDVSYFERLANEAQATIEKFGNFQDFTRKG